MRETRTSGLMRGSNGTGNNHPLLSTLPFYILELLLYAIMRGSRPSMDTFYRTK